MDLGLAFDDEDLDVTRKSSEGDHRVPYNVKICTPQWFEVPSSAHMGLNDEECSTTTEQLQHTMKFSGDFHYHKKDFAKAAEMYERNLDFLPIHNVSVRQDVRESLARCYVYLGQEEKSLELARELVFEMSSEDEARQRQSLILLSSVCEKAGRWAECVEALENLCSLQPYYPKSWIQLGDAYTELYENNISDAADDASMTHLVKPLTCYIKARLLCQLVLYKATDRIRHRNEQTIEELSGKIDAISLPREVKEYAVRYFRRDPETNQEDSKENQPVKTGDLTWKVEL